MVIIRLKEKNGYILYRRQRGKETSIPLYVVMNNQNPFGNTIMVEEFRTLKQAEKNFNLFSSSPCWKTA